MWDGLFMLLGLSIVMTAASFLAGILPLAFTLSSKQLRLITAVGTGVLVGTSLIVIIPEGVETLYAASGIEQHTQSVRSIPLGARAAPAWAPADLTVYQEHGFKRRTAPLGEPLHIHVSRQESQEHKLTGPDDGFPDDAATDYELINRPVVEEVLHTEWEPHAWVGISLIAGFILMYLIDKVPRHGSGSAHPKPSYVSLNRFTLRRTSTQNEEAHDEDNFAPPEAQQAPRPSSTTVGLVIHAAADGIALGASSSGSSKRLGFIVFFALMIHKAPAAFGLTSALLKQGLSKRRARTHLIIFSLAAPTGALLTWSAANMFGGGRFSGEEGTGFATGVLLLFSGGTFLYVAMHTMQDGGHTHSSPEAGQNGYADGNVYDEYQAPPPKQEGPTMTDTLACVGGMLLPLLTQFGHAH